MSFDYRNIKDPQNRLDLFIVQQARGTVIRADSETMLWLFNNDNIAAEEELRRWAGRHMDDCSVLNLYPCELKIHESIYRDPELEIIRDKWHRKAHNRAKTGRWDI